MSTLDASERAIVRWLREVVSDEPEHLTSDYCVDAGGFNTSADFLDAKLIATAIERGEHRVTT